jgi:hypothetical protein
MEESGEIGHLRLVSHIVCLGEGMIW